MKACVEVEAYLHSFLNLVLEFHGQLQAPVALPLAKISHCTLNRRLGWPQSRSGRFGEEKKISCPKRESKDYSLVVQPLVTIWIYPTPDTQYTYIFSYIH